MLTFLLRYYIFSLQIEKMFCLYFTKIISKGTRVKECVLRHRGSKDLPRNTVEEQCVADADVIAHFDCMPSLFHLGYKEMNLSVENGEIYLRKKLERDYNKVSDKTREIIKDRYENIIEVLFTNK